MAAHTVVVTGSTRGVGFGLVSAFLERGCNVVVHGRSKAADAAAKLGFPERVLAFDGDVTDAGSVRALWDTAEQRFGRVDVWVNNAGSGGALVPVAQLPLETCSSVVATNLTGCVLGTRVALEGMLRLGGGQIFNMEGFGSNPHIKRTGMAVYGATKCAVRYFTQSVSREVKGSTVKVGTLSPGIVVTQMLVGQFDGAPAAQWERSRRFYNKVADTVETVAPYLAERVLANEKNGAAIAWIQPAADAGAHRVTVSGWPGAVRGAAAAEDAVAARRCYSRGASSSFSHWRSASLSSTPAASSFWVRRSTVGCTPPCFSWSAK
ncbi:MAG: SDR family oxidoreductase [Archangiaceae bacterium]|nr:SDR family oxidoreductase [Archangiaceae bacterium]